MYYDSGNYYEGGFLNDVYHGDDWLYVWHDGDMETSSWRDGKQHGTRIYRAVLSSGGGGAAARGGGRGGGGTVQYHMYESNNAGEIGLRFADSGNAARRI